MKKAVYLTILFSLILSATSLWAAIPNPPSDLAVTALSSTQIRLTWTDNSSDEVGFRIEREL
jgi:hypothetical protein